jgi:hypothetical protein
MSFDLINVVERAQRRKNSQLGPSLTRAQLTATTGGYKDFNGNQQAGSHINWPAAA